MSQTKLPEAAGRRSWPSLGLLGVGSWLSQAVLHSVNWPNLLWRLWAESQTPLLGQTTGWWRLPAASVSLRERRNEIRKWERAESPGLSSWGSTQPPIFRSLRPETCGCQDATDAARAGQQALKVWGCHAVPQPRWAQLLDWPQTESIAHSCRGESLPDRGCAGHRGRRWPAGQKREMQSTVNYLWHTDDLLGQGATASVYKARNKKSGELVAVKVFNTASYLRPREVQVREFEVLRKLNHQNIIKLFAVEETGAGQQKVLVMEYCSSGSLLSVLESPENAFGLPEDEFLVVLRCVAAGMNHLRENGIVHRDIKPGNIMRLLGEEGQSIYKLTDFGAARELDDDEKFVSVYGTEEYLHPDMYERAVLRKPQQKAFGVTVDLWSIGVTLYHAATGSLPFVPFGGPRRNKEIMYRITTEKPAGAIAGTQRRENGPLEWSYTLPITCQLSMGLQSQLVPILANILEAEQAKCWGFDQFFAETSDILQRAVIHVFSLPQAVLHRVYVHAHNTIAIFLEAVYEQTRVAPQHQEYLFEGHLCVLEPSLSAQHIAHTTASSPLTLFSTTNEPPKGLAFRDPALDVPKFVPKVDLQADYSTAKGILGAGYQALRLARTLLGGQELMVRGLHWFVEMLQATCRRTLEVTRMALLFLSSSLGTERFSGVAGVPELQELQRTAELRSRLRNLAEVLSRCSHNITETQKTLSNLRSELMKDRDPVHEDTSIQQIQCCLDKMYLTYKQFKKSRMRPGLGYNEEQIHKLDKVNFSHLAKRLLQVFQEECVQKYQASLVTHGKRMRLVHETRNHLRLVGCSVAACNTEAQGAQESLSKILDRLSHQLLQERTQGAQASPPPTAPYPSSALKDLVLHMQELYGEMKVLASDLQDNNRIIEGLSRVPLAPDI